MLLASYDAIAEMVKRGSRVLEAKARSLKLALILLLAATVTFGVGIIVSTNGFSAGKAHHGKQGHVGFRTSPSPPTRTRTTAAPLPLGWTSRS
jgi:hypothetical protein